MNKIPKILHLYWGCNKKLSYLKYLTVYSFKKYNPDWKINIYVPDKVCKKEDWSSNEQKSYNYKGKDYINELDTIKFSFADIGIDSLNTPEVIKSDIFRLYILNKIGGVWSDFDILYFDSINNISVDNIDGDSFVCDNGEYYSIGFLISSKNNNLYRKLFENSKLSLKNNIYQSAGSLLFSKFRDYITLDKSVGNISFNSIYPIMWNQVDKLFGNGNVDFSNSIGTHWFGGSSIASNIENSLTENNIGNTNIEKLVKSIL